MKFDYEMKSNKEFVLNGSNYFAPLARSIRLHCQISNVNLKFWTVFHTKFTLLTILRGLTKCKLLANKLISAANEL